MPSASGSTSRQQVPHAVAHDHESSIGTAERLGGGEEQVGVRLCVARPWSRVMIGHVVRDLEHRPGPGRPLRMCPLVAMAHGTPTLGQVLQQVDGARQRTDLIGDLRRRRHRGAAEALVRLGVSRPPDFAEQGVREQPAAHPDPAMDAPHRELNTARPRAPRARRARAGRRCRSACRRDRTGMPVRRTGSELMHAACRAPEVGGRIIVAKYSVPNIWCRACPHAPAPTRWRWRCCPACTRGRCTPTRWPDAARPGQARERQAQLRLALRRGRGSRAARSASGRSRRPARAGAPSARSTRSPTAGADRDARVAVRAGGGAGQGVPPVRGRPVAPARPPARRGARAPASSGARRSRSRSTRSRPPPTVRSSEGCPASSSSRPTTRSPSCGRARVRP